MTDRSPRSQDVLAQAGPDATPFRLNLEQQRKRAKELHRALRAGDAAAWARFRACHPSGGRPVAAAEPVRLSEAQLVVARELGVPSWPKLKAHILAMQAAREAIVPGAPAPDREMATLHIRCGGDLRSSLRAAGFRGDFLEYADPLCQGPLGADADWIGTRASFLSQAYGAFLDRSPAQITANLERIESELDAAGRRYDRVVLWFEHDSYDQLILARCLARFAKRPPARLELVSADHYPGSVRFLGLGQLPPEALRLLWEARRPVSEAQRRAGWRVWDLLCAPDPTALASAAAEGIAELPFMARAIRRHCRELPGLEHGLSLTQQLVLHRLAKGTCSIETLFREVALELDPLPWLGDVMFMHIVEDMKQVRRPVFTARCQGEGQDGRNEALTLTELGRRVLAGEVDWQSLPPSPRVVGGVRIPAAPACWRWDAGTAMPVMT